MLANVEKLPSLLILFLSLLEAHHLIYCDLLQRVVHLSHVVCLLQFAELVETGDSLSDFLPIKIASVACVSEAEVQILAI